MDQAGSKSGALPQVYSSIPALRASMFEPDELDAQRVALVRDRWHDQDTALIPRDRQIEENLRMLAGQHWTVWSDLLGRFIDISEFLGERDEIWRQRPTINVLLNWFTLTKARLTENPPVISFQPATGDRYDAELAEVQDTIFKSKWNEAGMLEVVDRWVAMLIPGGSAMLKSRIDPRLGPLVPFVGPATLPVMRPDGSQLVDAFGQPLHTEVEDCCFDKDGNPLTQAFADEHGIGYGEPEGAYAHTERKGGLVVDVLSPLEVRGSWGEQIPWHLKQWHIHRTFMSPEEVWALWGVEVQPDVGGDNTVGELQRVLLGSGFFGAANSRFGHAFGAEEVGKFVSVYEMWERPCSFPGMEETKQSAGGRLTVIAGNKCVRDGVRPARFRYGSPIRRVDFINVPGRPSGTSPQEMLNPVVRAGNHSVGQILTYGEHCANPRTFIHESTGIDESDWTDEPGAAYKVATIPGVEPVTFAKMPPLGEDVHRGQALLFTLFQDMGNLRGAQGAPETRDPSGEVIRELRENSDRPVASTARAMVTELARVGEDWMALFHETMDDEEIVAYAGEDQLVRTLTVRKDLFEQGSVNVVPDVESMLPESRGERQGRIRADWQAGAFGDPKSPEARSQYLELARFPHLGRENLPGGIHRVTAQRENARLLTGSAAADVPVLEVYDNAIHLMVHEGYMASPEFLKQTPEVQQQFWAHREAHKTAMQAMQAQQISQQVQTAAALQGAAQAAGIAPAPGAPAAAAA